MILRTMFYREITEYAIPSRARFILGWNIRLRRVLALALLLSLMAQRYNVPETPKTTKPTVKTTEVVQKRDRNWYYKFIERKGRGM